MEINADMVENLASLQQAIGISNLRKSMKQDAANVATVIQSISSSNNKLIESSVTPHLGSHIDTRI